MKNRFKPIRFSLKWKFALVLVALVIAIMTVITYIFTIRQQSMRIQDVGLRMERLANNIATIRSMETDDWETYQTYIDHQLRLNPDIVYIAIYDEQNTLKVHALNADWVELGSGGSLTQREQAGIVWRLDQRQIAPESQRDLESKAVNIRIGEENRGTVKVGFSLVELHDAVRRNLVWNLDLALIFVAAAILISLFVSHRIITPLSKLTRAMAEVSRGNLEQEIPVGSRDEIGRLGQTFNFMTRGLKEKKHLEDFTRELGFSFEFEKIANLITERLTRALVADHGYLFIQNSRGELFLHNHYPESGRECGRIITLNAELRARIVKMKEAMPLHSVEEGTGLAEAVRRCAPAGRHALICPLTMQNDMIGFFVLDNNEKGKPYTAEERHFFTTLVRQAELAIDNSLLLEERTEKERMKRELEIARNVQMGLLPQSSPGIPGLDIEGLCLPAVETGGDYFDYFVLDSHTVGVVIADVTGKGTSAAFYMAMVKGMILSLAFVHRSPKRLLCEVNRRLYRILDRRMFVTMNYILIDTRKKNLILARAGHCVLMKREKKSGRVHFLMPAGIGLGLENGLTFDRTIREKITPLSRGDHFLLYTDGVTEAMNARKEQFGEDRLMTLVESSADKSSKNIMKDIVHALKQFTGEVPQHDDITMVSLKVT